MVYISNNSIPVKLYGCYSLVGVAISLTFKVDHATKIEASYIPVHLCNALDINPYSRFHL